MEKRIIKMSGDEILERGERWERWNMSRINLWDSLTEEHNHNGHNADDIDDCEECNERFDIESVEDRCDDKTWKEIFGDISWEEHHSLMNKFRETIKSMNLTVEIEC